MCYDDDDDDDADEQDSRSSTPVATLKTIDIV